MRRVLGEPKSWIEHTFHRQQPDLPDALGDPLVGFLCARVTGWEGQVVTEANEYRNGANGAVIVRYARDIRAQCAAVRRVLVRYAEARDADAPEAEALRGVIADLSFAFSNHPDWREDWNEEAPPA